MYRNTKLVSRAFGLKILLKFACSLQAKPFRSWKFCFDVTYLGYFILKLIHLLVVKLKCL